MTEIDYTVAGLYSYTVPQGIHQVRVAAWAGGGGSGRTLQGGVETTKPGGSGGYVSDVLYVRPGTVLDITVGSGGPAQGSEPAGDGGFTYVSESGTFLGLAAPPGQGADQSDNPAGGGGPGTVNAPYAAGSASDFSSAPGDNGNPGSTSEPGDVIGVPGEGGRFDSNGNPTDGSAGEVIITLM